MRIVYLHQYFNTPAMPGGTRSYELGRRLVSRGHEVHIITTWRGDTKDTKWFVTHEDGLVVHWLPVKYSNSMSYARRILAFLKFAMRAAGKAANIPADVIFATSTPLTIALPGIFAARRQGRPFVFEVRDLWPRIPIAMGALRDPVSRWLARKLERVAYRSAERIVALSSDMAEGIAETGYPDRQIVVVPNIADLDRFRPDPDKASRFRAKHPELGDGKIILYPGALGKINGVAYAADLAAALKDKRPSCRVVVIGKGVELPAVIERGKALLVLGETLFVFPPVPKQEIVEAFLAAAVVTSLVIDVPELEANSANKFFDGLASGTPVAVNYGGWQANLLRSSGAGLRLSRDPVDAASQLLEFLGNEAEVAQSGTRARELAEANFSGDLLASRLEEVLHDAIGSCANSGRS